MLHFGSNYCKSIYALNTLGGDGHNSIYPLYTLGVCDGYNNINALYTLVVMVITA